MSSTSLLNRITLPIAILLCMAFTNGMCQTFPNLQFSQVPISGEMTKGGDGLLYVANGNLYIWDGFRARQVPILLEKNRSPDAQSVMIADSLIWIDSHNSAIVYNRTNGKSIVYNQTNPDVRFRVNEELGCKFFKDSKGDMFLQAETIYRILPDFSLEEIKPLTKQLLDLKIKFNEQGVYSDRNKNEWGFFQEGRLARLNPDKTIGRLYAITKTNENAFKMFQDSRGRYWLYFWFFGLQLFDTATGACTPMNKGLVPDIVIHDMCEWKDNTGHNWFVLATAEGTYLMDPDNFSSKCYRRDHSKNIRLAQTEDEPTKLFVDDENILWLTGNGGNNYIAPVRQQFSNYSLNTSYHFTKTPFLPRTNGDALVVANRISCIDSTIWLGGLYGKGVSVFTKKMEFITNYPNYTKVNPSADSAFHDFNYVATLSKELLFFSSYKYVGIWDKKNGTKLFKDDKDEGREGEIFPPNFTTILPLPNRQFFIKANDYLYRFKYDERKLERYFSLKDSAIARVSPKQLRWAQFTRSGFWILYETGLLRYDTSSRKITDYYLYQKSSTHYFDENTALKFAEDTDGRLWIISSKKLLQFNPQTKQFTSFENKCNLPGGFNNILIDHQQRIWLQSGNTLYCFLPKQSKTLKFRSESVLPGTGLFGMWQDTTDNKIWMGDENYLTVFNPDSVINFSHQQQVYISALFQGDSLMKFNQNDDALFRFPYDKSTVTIQASFKYFNRINPSLLAFRLHANEPWRFSSNGNFTFYNLGPGNYELQLAEAFDEGNVLEDKMLRVHFMITPPFYKSTWFGLCVLLALAAITLLLFNMRIKTLKARSAVKEKAAELLQVKTGLEKQLAESEMAALRSQMNPHFIFNVLNSINRYILTTDTAQASNYLSGFSRLIRLVLENSKLPKVPLQADLEALKLYIDMEKMRFGPRFKSQIITESGVDAQFILVPPLLIQPYVENAIWHGLMQKEDGDGLLIIQLSQPAENLLLVEIIDNGIGRQKAMELKSKSAVNHKSFGMQITGDRISIVNKLFNIKTTVQIEDLQSIDGEPTGTKVSLEIHI